MFSPYAFCMKYIVQVALFLLLLPVFHCIFNTKNLRRMLQFPGWCECQQHSLCPTFTTCSLVGDPDFGCINALACHLRRKVKPLCCNPVGRIKRVFLSFSKPTSYNALLAIYSAHLDPGDQAGTDQHSRQQRCFAPGTCELRARPGSSEPLPALLCYRTGLCLSPALPFSANLLHSKLLFCSQLLCERATLTFLLFPLLAQSLKNLTVHTFPLCFSVQGSRPWLWLVCTFLAPPDTQGALSSIFQLKEREQK